MERLEAIRKNIEDVQDNYTNYDCGIAGVDELIDNARDMSDMVAVSLALYRAEQQWNAALEWMRLTGGVVHADNRQAALEEARAAWNAACAKWEASIYTSGSSPHPWPVLDDPGLPIAGFEEDV